MSGNSQGNSESLKTQNTAREPRTPSRIQCRPRPVCTSLGPYQQPKQPAHSAGIWLPDVSNSASPRLWTHSSGSPSHSGTNVFQRTCIPGPTGQLPSAGDGGGGGGVAAPPRARRASGGHRYFLGIDSALGRELTERPAQSSAFLKSCKMLTRMQGNLCFSALSWKITLFWKIIFFSLFVP